MGKIKNGLLGPVSGKVGNVVGSSWKGVDYLRMLPASVSNPRTPAQLRQRAGFLLVVRFLRPLLDLIKVGYSTYARRMSAYNAATSYVLRHALSGEFPDLHLDYARVLLSRGNLRGLTEVQIQSAASLQLTLQWENNAFMGNALPYDKVAVVVYNPAKADAFYAMDAALRADATLTISLPAAYLGDQVHVWVLLTATQSLLTGIDRNSISDSIYAGMWEVV